MFRKRRILLRRGIRKRQQRKVITDYEKLVAAGDVVAMLEYGEMFEKGIYVERNEAKAVALYEKAADEHYSLAVCKLIQFYTDRHDAEHVDYWMEKKREWDRNVLKKILEKKDGFGSVWEQAFYKMFQEHYVKKKL